MTCTTILPADQCANSRPSPQLYIMFSTQQQILFKEQDCQRRSPVSIAIQSESSSPSLYKAFAFLYPSTFFPICNTHSQSLSDPQAITRQLSRQTQQKAACRFSSHLPTEATGCCMHMLIGAATCKHHVVRKGAQIFDIQNAHVISASV